MYIVGICWDIILSHAVSTIMQCGQYQQESDDIKLHTKSMATSISQTHYNLKQMVAVDFSRRREQEPFICIDTIFFNISFII